MATEILRPISNVSPSNTLLLYPDTGESPWQDVDEVTPDYDTTYLYWTSSPQTTRSSYFGVPNSSIGVGTITSVEVHAICKQSPSGFPGTGWLYVGTQAGGVNGQLFSVSASGNWTEYTKIWATSPVTSSAWTWAEINDLKIGIAFRVSGDRKTWVTQIWAVINYVLAARFSKAYIIG